MPGVSIRIPGASFTKFVASLTLPDRTGLVEEFIFGGPEEKVRRNLANKPFLATVVGTPTYRDDDTLVSAGGTYGSHGFETGRAANEEEQTWISVAAIPRLSSGAVGTGTLNGKVGLGLAFNSGGVMLSHGGNSASPQSVILPVAETNSFLFAAGRGRVGEVGKVFASNGSGGLATAETSAAAGARPPSGTSFIGTSHFGNGQFAVAYAARFARVLPDAEISDVYASLKAFFDGQVTII